MRRASSSRVMAIVSCGTLLALSPSANAEDDLLLDPGKGQEFNDTASEGDSKISVVNNDAIGGRALQVVFAPGDSVGDTVVRVKDWQAFEFLEFSAINPGTKPLQ